LSSNSTMPLYNPLPLVQPSNRPTLSTMVTMAAPFPAFGSKCKRDELPCLRHGQIICASAQKWGMCNHGCMKPQAVAAGTTCTNGAIA
jgi:hypothetical protein